MHSEKITIISDQIMCINGDDVNIHSLKSIIIYGDNVTDYTLKKPEIIDKEESDLSDSFDELEPIDEIVISDKVTGKAVDTSIIHENVETAVDELSEYMTMKEAFDKCSDEDIPYTKHGFGFNDTNRLTKKELLDAFTDMQLKHLRPEQALSDKWQVQKSIHQILTTDQIRSLARIECDEEDTKGLMNSCIRLAEENGWNRTKELRECVKKYCLPDCETMAALKRLEPPE